MSHVSGSLLNYPHNPRNAKGAKGGGQEGTYVRVRGGRTFPWVF